MASDTTTSNRRWIKVPSTQVVPGDTIVRNVVPGRESDRGPYGAFVVRGLGLIKPCGVEFRCVTADESAKEAWLPFLDTEKVTILEREPADPATCEF